MVHPLKFFKKARTSRDTLFTRKVYYLMLWDHNENLLGIAECAPLSGLSQESETMVESQLTELLTINSPNHAWEWYNRAASSVKFAIEVLISSLQAAKPFTPFCSNTRPISINGLVWMDAKEQMFQEAMNKWKSGFTCIKFKVGALHFDDELDMIREFRSNVGSEIEIRLDANGAWTPEEAIEKLNRLAPFKIHSVEQPIRAHQWWQMNWLAKQSPIPIALDEELIGCSSLQMEKLLEEVSPHFLVLKPSLHGGLSQCERWIELANEHQIGWWVTSSLESNVGLNAIYRWLHQFHVVLPQGLGTGNLFENNWVSPLKVRDCFLESDPAINWKEPW